MENQHSETQHISVNMRTGVHRFITLSMILCVLGLFIVLYMLQDTVKESFVTNIPLNSTILLVTFYAIMVAFQNNLRLHRTARFLKKIEQIEGGDTPGHDDIQDLVRRLESQGRLLNIQNMYKALENLSVYGHLNFNDNDARLIKSKLGARVRSYKNIVSYFAGILVMLGLIGTFWGLLQTISAVGEAMGTVSANFSADQGEADIGQFIGSIAKPLQGMGVAFSSSLFGLSGSLFLGFLNFFAGNAQNEAIELISKWIDNRIPQMNPALSEKIGKQKVPKSDDLKAWLAGFVYLSSKTNQKMGQIMLALSKSTEAMLKSAYQTEKLYDFQKDIYMAVEGMSTRLNYLKENTQYITSKVDPALYNQTDIVSNLSEIKSLLSKETDQQNEVTKSQLERLSMLSDQIRRLNSSFDTMEKIQGSLVKEIEKLRERSQHEDNITEFTNLVWQLNSILEEIKQKNVSAYMNIFESYEEAEASEKSDAGENSSS
tara:strand:+ start:583 stop:2043 length:1461 start_codon:yes stop_codon:yes gene_type:complete